MTYILQFVIRIRRRLKTYVRIHVPAVYIAPAESPAITSYYMLQVRYYTPPTHLMSRYFIRFFHILLGYEYSILRLVLSPENFHSTQLPYKSKKTI